jgi:hypothetical protein
LTFSFDTPPAAAYQKQSCRGSVANQRGPGAASHAATVLADTAAFDVNATLIAAEAPLDLAGNVGVNPHQ